MADEVRLRGLRVLAHCGAFQDEREKLQPFEIDLDLECDQTKAGQSDDLSDAVDYGPICDSILNLAKTEQFSLIEKFAQTIVDSLFQTDPKIDAVTITLRKLRPPLQADVNTAAVKIHRSR